LANLTSRALGAVQSTLGVFVAVIFAVATCSLLFAEASAATLTQQEKNNSEDARRRRSKYIRLYLYSGKSILAATYLRRVFIDGRRFAAGAPTLTHARTVGTCGTKHRRGPLAALPGAGVWRHAWGHGARCPSAAQRGHGGMLRAMTANSDGGRQQTRFFWCRFKIRSRFETARSSSAFNFRVDKRLGEMGVRCHHHIPVTTRSHNFTFSVAAVSPTPPCSAASFEVNSEP
jgi:hypothetical protein